MSFICLISNIIKINPDHVLPIIGILIGVIFIELIIIYVLYKDRSKDNKGKKVVVSKEKFDDLQNKYKQLKDNHEQLKDDLDKARRECLKHNEYKDKYDKACLEIGRLKAKNEELIRDKSELTRDNNELNKLVGNESAIVVSDRHTVNNPKADINEVPEENTETGSPQTTVQEVDSTEEELETNSPNDESNVESSNEESNTESIKEEPAVEPSKEESKVETPKEKIMFASFPRSADSMIYFSDLSDNIVDDSYFELKITIASGQATFKPLDFMKIRNFDPAMAAMCTEGVKPNVASTVLGIEHGEAHSEGKNWIIDNLAKIKLA